MSVWFAMYLNREFCVRPVLGKIELIILNGTPVRTVEFLGKKVFGNKAKPLSNKESLVTCCYHYCYLQFTTTTTTTYDYYDYYSTTTTYNLDPMGN